MKVMGITGGVGSGKSTVLEYLKRLPEMEEDSVFAGLRIRVVEADKVAHDLQKPAGVCYDEIVSTFGSAILEKDGTINRRKLGDIVFADKDRLTQLNHIVHPQVKKTITDRIEEFRRSKMMDFVFVEAALLIEDHYDEICDQLWYIYAREDVRRERLKASRGYTDEKIAQMMAKQLDEETFRRTCQVIIDNSGTDAETQEQIRVELLRNISE